MTVIINRPRAAPMSHRGLDLYESPDVATLGLLSAEPDLQRKFVFEPCCGRNAVGRVLRAAGISVYASDIVDYGAAGQDGQADFFATTTHPRIRCLALDRAGTVDRDAGGKGIFAPIMEWDSREIQNTFSHTVVLPIDRYAPDGRGWQ